MKVSCTGLPASPDGTRADSSPWLTLDGDYTVLGVLAEPGGRVQLHLLTDDGESFGWFDSDCFLTVDPSVPANWSARISEDGIFELAPPDWTAEGFWERYYDGEPNARKAVSRELAIILGGPRA